MGQRRRIGAYGLCRNGDRVLLVRASQRTVVPGVWQIPGGGVDHGEHPEAAVVREFAEETGLTVRVAGLRAVVADVRHPAHPELATHLDRIVYDVVPTGGTLRDELTGTSDRVAWLGPVELAVSPLMPFTAELLGRPVAPLSELSPAGPDGPKVSGGVPGGPGVPGGVPGPGVPGGPVESPVPTPTPAPDRGQRFAAYGLVTDADGRMLLTRIADGYPGAGRWHLPGGGTGYGEQPERALLRELVEETGQLGRVTGLLEVAHRHTPAALGPEGRPIDWHAVWVVYRVMVERSTPARITEAAGGSTAEAGWFRPAAAARLPMTGPAAAGLRWLASEGTAGRAVD